MGWFRFRRTVRLAKGVRVNVSKTGASLSVGKPGATLNLGRRSRVTVGLPGSGLSYTQPLKGGASEPARAAVWAIVLFALLVLLGKCLG